MSTPLDLQARPGNFGPDPSKTDEKPNFDREPSAAAKKAKDVLGSLGENTKPRSGVRQLGAGDRAWIQGKYLTIARFTKSIHPNFAEAVELQSEMCADAWMNLAAKNDKVRRQILAAIEGGAWGELFLAHSPIFMALLPEKYLMKLLDQSMELFGSFLHRSTGEDSE